MNVTMLSLLKGIAGGSPRSRVVARWVLGATFAWASASKLSDIDLFALNISAYELLPVWAVRHVALALAPTELLLGLALLGGFAVRYAVRFAAALLSLFAAAIASAWVRGIEISCGCFSLGASVLPPGLTTWLDAPAVTLARDALLIAVCWYVARGESRSSAKANDTCTR